jgi:N-ethylmaleimide reductase
MTDNDPLRLLTPITVGALRLRNRIFMAPLTRGRANDEFVPQPMMAEYYAQRAGAGLIFTEATGVSREGLGWPRAPGIWTDEQTEAWKPIVRKTHEAGGWIFCQLWHMGRLVHPVYLGGAAPVSSSATCGPGHAHTPTGKQPYAPARALGLDEIPRIMDDYVRAASNAMKAGFDGVQLHAANGYLIDQFLRDGANLRDDAYGGPLENRLRLLGEVTSRLVEIWGSQRVSVRLSPNGNAQGVNDSEPHVTFAAAAALLNRIGICCLEIREPGLDSTFGRPEVAPVAPAMRKAFGGVIVLNSDYDKDKAEAAIRSGLADAISFGRPFIANPDLPQRIVRHASWAKDDVKTWYRGDAAGYTDYPGMEETIALSSALSS